MAQQTDFPEHFAMVRQIDAEATHFPDGVFEVWQEAGPRRVRREVVARLGGLAEQGLLHIDDLPRAALHLVVLTTAEVREQAVRGTRALTAQQATEMVAARVSAFLQGYAPVGSTAGGVVGATDVPERGSDGRRRSAGPR